MLCNIPDNRAAVSILSSSSGENFLGGSFIVGVIR
jgi:hypothetical protein